VKQVFGKIRASSSTDLDLKFKCVFNVKSFRNCGFIMNETFYMNKSAYINILNKT